MSDAFSPVKIGQILVFGLKLKKDMIAAGRKSVRRSCPFEHSDGQAHFVRAILAGRKQHIHMGCDDPSCSMRMME